MPDVAEIAGRLSEAQRAAVFQICATPNRYSQVAVLNRNVFRALVRKGIMQHIIVGMVSCASFTETGLAVRAYLENSRVTD